MTLSEMSRYWREYKRPAALKPGQYILVRAVVGPSGITDRGTMNEGVFVRMNPDDPEIWLSTSDVILERKP